MPYRDTLVREGRILHDRWEDDTAGKVVFQSKHVSPTELKMARPFRKVVERERPRCLQRRNGVEEPRPS